MNLDLRDDIQRKLGIWEYEISSVFDGHKQVKTAVDIGAGDGFYTLFFMKRTMATRVFAFEPSDEARGMLMRNLRANKLETDSRLSVSSLKVGSEERTGMTSLESLCMKLESPCIVKVDVEGAESNVLAGASSVLGLSNITWVIETHSLALEQECRSILVSRGYNAVVVPNGNWRFLIPELRPIPHNRWIVAKRVDEPSTGKERA